MADKEERIIIAVAEPSLFEGGADKIFPCITRQDAIMCMAEAMFCASGFPKSIKRKAINALYKDYAEKALNALLEGVEK